jgi:uncharacterized protein YciI
MPLYFLEWRLPPESGPLDAAERDRHDAFLKHHSPPLKLAGAFEAGGEAFRGWMAIMEAESVLAASEFARRSPMSQSGLFTEPEPRPFVLELGPNGSKQ